MGSPESALSKVFCIRLDRSGRCADKRITHANSRTVVHQPTVQSIRNPEMTWIDVHFTLNSNEDECATYVFLDRTWFIRLTLDREPKGKCFDCRPNGSIGRRGKNQQPTKGSGSAGGRCMRTFHAGTKDLVDSASMDLITANNVGSALPSVMRTLSTWQSLLSGDIGIRSRSRWPHPTIRYNSRQTGTRASVWWICSNSRLRTKHLFTT